MPSSLSRRARSCSRTSALTLLTLATGLGATAGLVGLGTGTASASALSPLLRDVNVSTVYTETNQVAGNSVLAYRAEPGGALTPIGSYATGGTGTGVSAASQGGVTLGDDGQLLAVVNGGSNSVSVYAVGRWGGLQLIETASSGGTDPISVAINGLWVYALNAGTTSVPGNISGFVVGGPSARVTQPLSSAASSPEQVGFTPDGRDLLVTEKASSTIDVFPVNFLGAAQPAVTTTVPGSVGPYGFAFAPNGNAVVSEAAVGAVATFAVSPKGGLTQLSAVPDGQLAPCWVALSANGDEAFAANAHSGTISAYDIAPNGALTLLSPAVQADPGVADTDLAVAGNSNLYISDQPNFDASAIAPSGTLSPSTIVASALPAGTFGLAATNGAGFSR